MNTAVLDSEFHDRWNEFIAASRYGHTLQTWEWGDLKKQNGQEPVRVGWFEGGRLVGAAQILLRPLPLGLGRLAYVPKGPVIDYDDADLLGRVLSDLNGLALAYRATSLKIEPEVVEPSRVPDLLRAAGLEAAPPVQMRSTIWVDLVASEEEMLARQRQKTRYNIRLAARRGVQIAEGKVRDVDAWYRMYQETAERDGFTIHPLRYYGQVISLLQAPRIATLLLAYHEGDLLAGIIVFKWGQKAQYMYGASSNQKRNLMAPYLLQWEGMRWAKAAGASTYDLWGIPDKLDEDEELWGVYVHKRGYGGEIVRYVGAFDIVRSPLQHLALERVARPLFKRATRLGV
jgi:lipid II:glycine glycyltransferase (peptidoglycan interpeptide bridge formation enzyme)